MERKIRKYVDHVAARLETKLERVNFENETISGEARVRDRRIQKIDEMLGNREVPWENLVNLITNMEITIQAQVHQEMDLQVRKMMDVMMYKMVEERWRQTQREGNHAGSPSRPHLWRRPPTPAPSSKEHRKHTKKTQPAEKKENH